MEKALHEAKENSSWIEPNLAWDKAVKDFAERILRTTGRNIFLESFEPFATRIAELGAINSLTQTVLKLTVPGVPDIYQGQELWDLSLVDPDNRRPVDYDTRRQQLDSLTGTPPATDLLRDWRDGRIKLFATQKLLRLRRVHPLLFSRGSYVPVNVEGEFAQSCLAFIREEDAARILVIVPRLSARIGFPPIGELWKETRLIVALAGQWRELFTGQARLGIQALHVSEAFQYFPFAVYVSS